MRHLHPLSLTAIFATALLAPAGAAVFSHYSFDTDYTDVSGNGRDGTLTDVGTTGNSGIIDTVGSYVFGGGAMDFSDEADYVAIPSNTFSSGSPYTIAFWAQRDSTANTWNMVIGDQTTNFFIALNNSGYLRWRSSSSVTARQQDFTTPVDTEWHHYAVIASGTDITLYLDGGSVLTGTGKQTGFILNGIGSAYPAGNGFDFRGRIDEMWVFDEALDATQVSNLKNFNSLVPEPASGVLIGLGGLLLTLRRRR